jgi:hypothetical protein
MLTGKRVAAHPDAGISNPNHNWTNQLCCVFLQAIAQVQHEENAKLNEEIERLRSELTKVWVDSVNQILFLVLLQALQAPQTHPDGKYGPPSPHIPHTKEEAM